MTSVLYDGLQLTRHVLAPLKSYKIKDVLLSEVQLSPFRIQPCPTMRAFEIVPPPELASGLWLLFLSWCLYMFADLRLPPLLVERLSFEEFFHHPFLDLPKRRSAPDADTAATKPSPLDPQANPSSPKPSGPRTDPARQGSPNIASMKPPPPLSSSPFHHEGGTRGRSISSGGAEYALKHGSRDWDSKGPVTNTGAGRSGGGAEGGVSHQQGSGRVSERGSQRAHTADSLQKGRGSADSMEGIEREYVVIHGPLQASSEMGQESGLGQAPVPAQPSAQTPPFEVGTGPRVGSAEAASEGSRGHSHDGREDAQQAPSPPARIASLHRCARLITELAIDKVRDDSES